MLFIEVRAVRSKMDGDGAGFDLTFRRPDFADTESAEVVSLSIVSCGQKPKNSVKRLGSQLSEGLPKMGLAAIIDIVRGLACKLYACPLTLRSIPSAATLRRSTPCCTFIRAHA